MNYLAKEQNRGSNNALPLDTSIALSAVAALAALVLVGLTEILTLPLLCAVVGGIAVALFRHKKQKQH
jgi:hypothetical protein